MRRPGLRARRPERRVFLLGGAAALFSACAAPRPSAQRETDSRLAQLESELNGRIGLCALDTGTGAHLRHRGAERYAMCSTFKWVLAAAVLAQVDEGRTLLAQPLSYGPADLLGYSPVTTEHVTERAMPIVELCQAAVELSDNTAANLLLSYIGGPPSLTRFLRRIGDTSTPDAMVATMQRILLGQALRRDSRTVLLEWLENCRTGLHRLRAGLPPDWSVGDKTGTGQHGAANDDAIIWPPGRAPILIALFLSDSQASADALDATHAQIGRIVAATFA